MLIFVSICIMQYNSVMFGHRLLGRTVNVDLGNNNFPVQSFQATFIRKKHTNKSILSHLFSIIQKLQRT